MAASSALAACSAGSAVQTTPAAIAGSSSQAVATSTTQSEAGSSIASSAELRAPSGASARTQMFFDGFQVDRLGGAAAGWTVESGKWYICQPPGLSQKYCQTAPDGLSVPTIAGQNAWSDYTVDASVSQNTSVDPAGSVMILGHVVNSTHYYDLEMRPDRAGSGKQFWYIGKQNGSTWTEVAGGPIVTQGALYYGLRLAFAGDRLSAYAAYNYSSLFTALGSGTDSSYTAGGIGLESRGASNARFDSVRVTKGSSTGTPPPIASPAPTPTASAQPTTAPSGTVVWQAGTSLGHWETSNTYQCGNPVNSGASFTFHLARNGTNCGRNQAQTTTADGGLVRLNDGQQYTFDFTYIDGMTSGASPGMGYDADARSLIWQIHPYGGGNPCTGLNFDNGGVVGQAQQWTIGNCNATLWRGTYAPGETDHWRISVYISQTSSGYIKAYRNGSYLGQWGGATYSNTGSASGDPWFNFGPYKWRWELANGGGSTMTQINATINNMTVTTP